MDRASLRANHGRISPALTMPRHQVHSTRSLEGVLEHEIAQEQAAALGRLGRALERALTALAEYERAHAARGADPCGPPASKGTLARARLVEAASDALWCFIIQRECCGLRDSRSIMREYGVPPEVHNRMGVFAANRTRQRQDR